MSIDEKVEFTCQEYKQNTGQMKFTEEPDDDLDLINAYCNRADCLYHMCYDKETKNGICVNQRVVDAVLESFSKRYEK